MKGMTIISEKDDRFLVRIGAGLLCYKDTIYEGQLPEHPSRAIDESSTEESTDQTYSYLETMESLMEKKYPSTISEDCLWDIVEMEQPDMDPLRKYYKEAKTDKRGKNEKKESGSGKDGANWYMNENIGKHVGTNRTRSNNNMMFSSDLPSKVLSSHYSEQAVDILSRILLYKYELVHTTHRIIISKNGRCFTGEDMGKCKDHVLIVRTIDCEKKLDEKERQQADKQAEDKLLNQLEESVKYEPISEDIESDTPTTTAVATSAEKERKPKVKDLLAALKKKKAKKRSWKWPSWKGVNWRGLC